MKTGQLLIAIIAAFALRLVALNDRPVWYDEAFAILYASRSFAEMIAGTVTQVAGVASDVHPLFYYFSLHVWMQMAGDSAFAVRFWSVWFGVATLPLVYHLARVWFGRRVGLIAAVVVALAPFHLAYSQEARMYAQLGFWCALALTAFLFYRANGRARWWSGLVIAGAFALYSHNLAFINFAALGTWVVFDAIRTRQTRVLRATLLAGGGMILLWLPWLLFVPGQFGKIAQAYWVPPPTLATVIQTALVWAFDFDNARVPALIAPLFLFGALAIPILIAFESWRARRTLRGFPFVLAFVPILLLIALSQWRPVYIIRALLPAFFWYAILFAWTLKTMPRVIGLSVTVMLGAIIGATLPAYYGYRDFPRAPFEAVARTLQNQVQPGDAIVHDNKLSFFPMHYYRRDLPQAFIADPPGAGSDTLALPTQRALQLHATSLDAATQNKARVWFIIFQPALDQAAETGRAHSNVAWLDEHFQRVGIDAFADLRVYRYETR